MGFIRPKQPKIDTKPAEDLEASKKDAQEAEKRRRALLFGTQGGEAGQLLGSPNTARNTLLGN